MNKYTLTCIGFLLSIVFVGSFAIQSVSAHVAYVVPEEKIPSVLGADWGMLTSTLSYPAYSLLMVFSAVAILLLAGLLPRIPLFKTVTSHVVSRLKTYHEFIPWIIRIALGIAFLGAGTTGVLISPSLPDMWQFATLQITLGFLFLLGFLLVPVTFAAIILYLVALHTDIYLIGNIETLALLIGFLVFHSYRPGLDDIFGFTLFKHIHFSRRLLAPILRLGIGVAMIFLALYEKILNPHMSVEVVSMYNLTSVVPVDASMWVLGAGIVEFMVGLFLLIGFYTRTTAFVAFLVLSTTFFFFKESVTAHITLFALLSILLIEGGGRWSIDSLIRKAREVVFVFIKNKKGEYLIVQRDVEPYKGQWSLVAGKGGLLAASDRSSIVTAAQSEVFWDLGISATVEEHQLKVVYSDETVHICEMNLEGITKKEKSVGHALDTKWVDEKDILSSLTAFNNKKIVELYLKYRLH